MTVMARGTHPALNAALEKMQLTQAYGLAVWAYDELGEYVAPVSSINYVPHDDVDEFNDQFLRTKRSLSETSIGEYITNQAPAVTTSKQFPNHVLSHLKIEGTGMFLQIVSDKGEPVQITQTPEYIIEIAQNIDVYKQRQGMSYTDIFGLKNPPRHRNVMACDINDFSKFASQQRDRLESVINMVALAIAEDNNAEIMNIMGDEVRFMYESNQNTKKMYKQFIDLISKKMKVPIFVRSVVGAGMISESFNGHYDDLTASKHYKGPILTDIGLTLKKARRTRSSLTILKP